MFATKAGCVFTENKYFYCAVKKRFFSKNQIIRHKSELARHFRELLPVDPDLQWGRRVESGVGGSDLVELDLDGRKLPYRVVYELRPSVPGLEWLRAPEGVPALLVTAELSDRVLAGCRERGIATMDLNGRTWLRAPGLLVDRGSLPGRGYRHEPQPRTIFVGLSARITRRVLTDRDRAWRRSEIGAHTGASPGLVTRVVQYLISQGFAEPVGARLFRLRDPLGLIDAWAERDRFAGRTLTTQYAGTLESPLELAHRLQAWAREAGIPIAFTQWIAAWVRHPHTEPVVCAAYLPRGLDPTELETLGLRRVAEGGKLWVHEPSDAGPLLETQVRGGLTLTSDAQIYLDLLRTGLRGPEAAAAMREWEGFCRG